MILNKLNRTNKTLLKLKGELNMSILQNHIKKEIRFQKGDLILYEPNKIQEDELKEILQKKISINEQGEVKGELNIRYIYRELTSIGSEVDDLSDSDFADLINEDNDKYDTNMNLLYNEVIFLIDEISEAILYTNMQQMKTINSMVNIMNSEIDATIMKNKLEKLFKRKKINISVDELIKNQGDTVALEKLLQQRTMPVNAKINKTK